MPKLSIIIVTYNSEKLIGPCLESVFKTAAGLDFEIIIIDNNSQDGTVDLIKDKFLIRNSSRQVPSRRIGTRILDEVGTRTINYPSSEPPQAAGREVTLTENKENIGFARAINQGVKIAQGEFVLFLNPDMRVLDKAIYGSLKFLEENKEAGLLGAQLLYPQTLKIQPSFGRSPSFFTEFLYTFGLHRIFPWGRFIYKNIFSSWKFKKTRTVDWVGGGFMMIKKEVFDKVGVLDENFFLYLEDIDFCWRARKAGYEIYYFPQARVEHHHMASSKNDLSKPIIYEAKSLMYYFEKYKKNVGLLKFLIRLRIHLRIFVYLFLLGQKHRELLNANTKVKEELFV